MCVRAHNLCMCTYVLGHHPCRLRPLVSGNTRELDSPIVLDGHEIPKGVSFRLTYVLSSIARRKLSRIWK